MLLPYTFHRLTGKQIRTSPVCILATCILCAFHSIAGAEDAIQRAGAGADVVFRTLDLESAVTSMEMSEDGKFIAFTHQGDNLVTVYDVVAGAVATEFECPAPRNVLWRGKQIIVASRIEGVIRFFVQRNGDWKQTREWRVPKTGVVHIAAASGRAFKGQLFVTCHGDGSQASYQDSMIFATSASGKFQPISKSALGTVSYDGKIFMRHESFNLSSGGQVSGYLSHEYIRSGGDSRKVLSGDARSNTYVYQIAAGGYWIGRDTILAGVPLTRHPADFGNLVIPDRTQKKVYVVADDVMTGRELSATAASLGVRRIQFPKPFGEMQKLRHGWAHRRNYLLDHPEAATHDDKTHLFIRTAEGGIVLTAQIAPFAEDLPKDKPAGNEQSTNRPGNDASMPPLGTAVNAKPRTWKNKSGSFSVVATLIRPDGDNIVLKRADNGDEFSVPLDVLSDADVRYLKRQQKQAQ